MRASRILRCFIFAAVCTAALSADPTCEVKTTRTDVILAEMCHKKNLAGVKKALADGANPNLEHYTDDATPLHIATFMGSSSIVEALLESGLVKDVNKMTRIKDQGNTVTNGGVVVSGFSCLHIAAQEGHVKISRLLLEAGADPEMKSDGITTGATALHLAALYAETGVARKLLNAGAKTTTRSTVNYTLPLWAAAKVGSLAVVKLLLEHGADVNGIGGPPASRNEKLNAPSGSAFADWSGKRMTALHVAVDHNHIRVVRALIDAGADQTIKERGWTARAIAKFHGWKDIVALLDPEPLQQQLQDQIHEVLVWLGQRRQIMICGLLIYEGWNLVRTHWPGTCCARWHPDVVMDLFGYQNVLRALMAVLDFLVYVPIAAALWLYARVAGHQRPAEAEPRQGGLPRDRTRTPAQREARRLKLARNRALRRLTKAVDSAVNVALQCSASASKEATWAENFATVCGEEQEKAVLARTASFVAKMRSWVERWPSYRRAIFQEPASERAYIAGMEVAVVTALGTMKRIGDAFSGCETVPHVHLVDSIAEMKQRPDLKTVTKVATREGEHLFNAGVFLFTVTF